MLNNGFIGKIEVQEELIVRWCFSENLRVFKEGRILVITDSFREFSELSVESLEGLKEDSKHLATHRVFCDCGEFRLQILPVDILLIVFLYA